MTNEEIEEERREIAKWFDDEVWSPVLATPRYEGAGVGLLGKIRDAKAEQGSLAEKGKTS